MEHKTWWKCIPYGPRIDYVSFQNNELVFVLAIEKLLELETPPQGDLDADAPLRAEPDPLAPDLARHLRARDRGDLDVLVRVPRARAAARPVRARRRLPDAHALLPGRRARRGHPARLLPRVPPLHRGLPEVDGRLRGDALAQRDLARAHRGDRPALGRRRDRARPVRPGAARAPASTGTCAATSPTSRTARSTSRAGLPERRRLRPLPRAHGRDARVGPDRRPVPRPARGHGGRAVDRGRPQGRAAAAARAPHVDGVADPPLQARHRGLPRARGRGLRDDRVAARRARLLRRLGRRAEAVARQVPRAVVRRPARRPRPACRTR